MICNEPFERARRRMMRVRMLEESIACKRAYIKGLRACAAPAAGIAATGRSDQPADKTGAAAVKIADLEEEIASLEARLCAARRDTERLIARLPSPRSRCLLEMRYLSALPWEGISEALGISPRAALRRHQRALQLVSGYLEEEGDA